MQVGESTVSIGEHATLGPVRIELFQPSATRIPISAVPKATPTEALLEQILDQLQDLTDIVTYIHIHMTRPPWWKRLYIWVTNHVAFLR